MGYASRILDRGSLVVAFVLAGASAAAQDASPWAPGLHSQVRLVAGGIIKAGRHLAGVEILLDKGFKTYWRDPGESGLPPRFEWSGSLNAGAVELRWPAPSRTEDAGGVAHTYSDRVLFPLLVTPETDGEPVRLALSLEYGVCKEICIPARAEVALTLRGQAGGRARIGEAMERVPQPQPLGVADGLSILSVEPVPGPKPRLAVAVRRPAGSSAALFVEAPPDWFVAVPATAEEAAPGEARFEIEIVERPKDAPRSIPLRLTLVAGGKAVESEATVAVPGPSP